MLPILYIAMGAALLVKGSAMLKGEKDLTNSEKDDKRITPKAKSKPISSNEHKLENSGFDSDRVSLSGLLGQTAREPQSTLKEVTSNESENNAVDGRDSAN